MCCDAYSRQAIVNMYTVHMLGEGGSLAHTFRHIVHALSEPKGIKGSSLL